MCRENTQSWYSDNSTQEFRVNNCIDLQYTSTITRYSYRRTWKRIRRINAWLETPVQQHYSLETDCNIIDTRTYFSDWYTFGGCYYTHQWRSLSWKFRRFTVFSFKTKRESSADCSECWKRSRWSITATFSMCNSTKRLIPGYNQIRKSSIDR